ncbi:hypothetical protein CLOSTMETH_03129 [[Clostridium] methylpentosum DSM 5476]|uniref:Uncharacterized protein n=1 Tax=[Clostridium] methylpentosum DSM 5476 TaxID=537013 RepID=C0EGY5_9FIRM|nr:hypothetical protein CLOSTMETH_03129 [[Clostridium] methylpentosum DSM 5476]
MSVTPVQMAKVLECDEAILPQGTHKLLTKVCSTSPTQGRCTA